MSPRLSVDRAVAVVGVVSVLLGVVYVGWAALLDRPVGTYGVVPEVVIGFQAIVLGEVAILSASSRDAGRIVRLWVWISIGAVVVSTAAVLITTLHALGRPVGLDPDLARVVVLAGRGILVGGVTACLVWLVVALVSRGFAYLGSLGYRLTR